jgi:hypothetical protein
LGKPRGSGATTRASVDFKLEPESNKRSGRVLEHPTAT